MIPIDAKLADERDAPDEAIPLDRIMEAIDGAEAGRDLSLLMPAATTRLALP